MFSEFLNNIILYPFFITLVRLSGVMMTVPMFADKTVNQKVRITIAFFTALALSPIISEFIPTQPESITVLTGIIMTEFFIGLLLGFSAKLFMSSINIAGDFISAMMGLQAASMFDQRSGTNTTSLSVLLSLIAVMSFITLDLHLYMIEAFVQSYSVVEYNKQLDIGEITFAIVNAVQKITILGVKLAAPVVILNFLINVSLGVLNRLVPQIHVFFISMPLTMLVGIFVLVLSLASMLILFTEEIQDNMVIFSQVVE